MDAMTNGMKLPALALAALFGVTACGGDSDTAPDANPGAMEAPIPGMVPGEAPEIDPADMALIMEAQGIQQRLGMLGDEVMQDPAMMAQLEALQDRIDDALRRVAPDAMAAMEGFQAEFAEAQANGDQATMQRIQADAQVAQAELQEAQQDVLSRPEIAAAIDAFEEAQRSRMLELDPEAADLMERLDEIMAELGIG
jgi:2',3'-cyclic-nucleotide 2'-phosphodiesterase (5'-nucleotidase family)